MAIEDQTALVKRIKTDLLARGVIPPNPTDNGVPFQITARVAWALRDRGAMLIRKSGAQNGWTIEKGPHAGQRVSHDSIAFPDGWVDLLGSAGPPANENRPVWQWHDAAPPQPTAVLAPFDLDALDPPPPEEGDEEGGGAVPLPDLVAIIQSAVDTTITAALAPMQADIAEIRAVQARGLQIPYLGTAKPPK